MSVQNDIKLYGADVHGVRQMVIYGLKGLASYARHAELLGQWDQKVGEFVHEVRKVSCRDADYTASCCLFERCPAILVLLFFPIFLSRQSYFSLECPSFFWVFLCCKFSHENKTQQLSELRESCRNIKTLQILPSFFMQHEKRFKATNLKPSQIWKCHKF